MSHTTSFVALIVLAALSAFFSASETALVSMGRLRLRRAIERHGRRARRLVHWQRHSDRLLTTILIGNNLVNIAATSIAALLVSTYIPNPQTAIWVTTGIMTSVILIFGEILPKQVAKRVPEPVAVRLIGPLVLVSIILRPLVWLFGGIVHGLARAMGLRGATADVISRADVEATVAAAGEEGTLPAAERMLLEEALGLRHTTVREIMTPRIQMVTVRRSDTIADAKRVIAESGYSRLPVEGGEPGEIVGVLFAKDILLSHETEDLPAPLVVDDLMRPPQFVPEMVVIDRLMELFRQKQTHLAMVIGEHGDVVGLVTMEDVFERLVGQIEDEYDVEKADIRRLSERRVVVRGDTHIADLRRTLGIDLPEGEYETIGGYLITKMGRIPSRGAALRWKDWLIQVYDADERRVREVSVQKVGRLGRRRGADRDRR